MEKLEILKQTLASGATTIIHESFDGRILRLCTTNHELLEQVDGLPKDVRHHTDAKKDESKDFIRLYDLGAGGWRTLKLQDILWCTGMDLGIFLKSEDIDI